MAWSSVRRPGCAPIVAVSIWFLGILWGSSAALGAETFVRSDGNHGSENPHVLRPRTKSVAVFKNGYGFFVREGDVSLRDGWCVSSEVPPAAFGTLAIFAESETSFVDIVGSGPGEIVAFDGIDAAKDVATIRKRLAAYQNLDIELTYDRKGRAHTVAGSLQTVGSEYAILDAPEGTLAVPVADVQQLQLLDLPLRIHVSEEEDGSPASAKVAMAYLRSGITWIPEYTMQLINEDTAQLTLRATLVNEAEDLIDCNVSFVVGVPNFKHIHHQAPLALGQVIRSLGAATAPSGVMSQAMARSQVVQDRRGRFRQGASSEVESVPVASSAGNLGTVTNNLPGISGEAAADYTVFKASNLTVRKGEKALVTLFTTQVKFDHRYEWQLGTDLQHYLSVTNESDHAWTTGPCLVLRGRQPLSEDLIKYTPTGAECRVPVTTGVNIRTNHKAVEIERSKKDYSPRDHYFLDRVLLEGTVELHSYEDKPALIEVTIPVTGVPLSASDEGDTWTDPDELFLQNRRGTVTWRITLAPNESKVLTYEYKRFVPSM